VVRWPLLGLVVAFVLGQRARWRRDPALLRAYMRASWVWVGQYLVLAPHHGLPRDQLVGPAARAPTRPSGAFGTRNIPKAASH
jgi:hypothetical protein